MFYAIYDEVMFCQHWTKKSYLVLKSGGKICVARLACAAFSLAMMCLPLKLFIYNDDLLLLLLLLLLFLLLSTFTFRHHKGMDMPGVMVTCTAWRTPGPQLRSQVFLIRLKLCSREGSRPRENCLSVTLIGDNFWMESRRGHG